jgi:hypothetical protein
MISADRALWLKANWRYAALLELDRLRPSPEDTAAFITDFERLANAYLLDNGQQPDFAVRPPLHLARPKRKGRLPEGYGTYADYLRSEHWQGTRLRALSRAGNRCENPNCWARLLCWWWDWADDRCYVYDPANPISLSSPSKDHTAIRVHLEVHHLNYDRLGHEWAEDLIVLCGRCHDLAHVASDEPKP